MRFSHETLQAQLGRRTAIPIVVCVHSTILGPAVGGCRVRHYEDFQAALKDCLLLSEAMTYKAAAIDNGTGGGKSVAAVPADWAGFKDSNARTALFLDIADIVEQLGGIYHVAPDVGSTPEDMAVARRRTRYVAGLPVHLGGAGGTTHGTAIGIFAALKFASERVLATDSLRGLKVAIQGLGGVGALLVGLLAKEGASVIGTDIDPARRSVVESVGGKWVEPDTIISQACDIFAPCALGGILNEKSVPTLQCRLIVGGANNQLASDAVEDLMTSRGIVYIPDFVANAGGVAYSTGVEINGMSSDEALKSLVNRITTALEKAFEAPTRSGLSLTQAAYRHAEQRLAAGGSVGPSTFLV